MAVQPGVGALARNVSLPGVRRLHLARIRYDLCYRAVADPDRVAASPAAVPRPLTID
jgi:hypothetical protein